MSERRNFCPDGGTLVSGNEWLPAEAFDFNWGSVSPVIGCNHIVCGDCGATVRHAVGYRVPLERANAFSEAVVYKVADWSTLPYLEHSPRNADRFYLCRCRSKSESSSSPLDHPAIDPIRGFISRWRCAGHPAFPVPGTLDGVSIRPDTDLDALAAAALASPMAHVPPGVPPATIKAPAFWLSRLYSLLAGSEQPDLGRSLALAVSRLLASPDPMLRRGAIEFYYNRPWSPGAERLAELVRDQLPLYAGQTDPTAKNYTLLERAFRSLQARLNVGADSGQSDPVALEVMRDEVLRGGESADDLLYTLAKHDPAWLRDHAVDIGAKAPAVLSSLVYLVRGEPAGWLGVTLGALAQRPGVSAQAVRNQITKHIAEPTRSEVLAALDGASL